MFGIKPKTLHYWYKEELSSYKEDLAAGRWGNKIISVVDEQTGEVKKEKPLPIAKPENMGSHMTIDEKQIGKIMYTIMTNSKTGKIALLAQTMKSEELKQAIENYLSNEVDKVKSISCDMSPSYKKFCREVFPNATIVIDKFHVVKYLIDAMQQIRRQLKTQCLTNKKNLEKQIIQDQVWTDLELLQRCRYILLKMQIDWDDDEKGIMEYLFNRFPTLQTAYELTQKLRLWYNGKNIGKNLIALERELYNWYNLVEDSKILAFMAVQKMIEKHEDDIMNYFIEGQTNAKAENMNSKIQRFLTNNYGIKDRDFFLFRVAGYFS